MRTLLRTSIALGLLSGPAWAQVPAPGVDHRPSQSRFVDERGRGPATALPAGRGQAPVPRGAGGPSDFARAGSHGGPTPLTPDATPSYGLAPGTMGAQTYDLMPGSGPRQGYYENPQGYYATPEFSAPEPRVE